jgi:hypothetical protein
MNLLLTCVIANIRHAWLDEFAVHAIRKKFKLSSDGGDSGSKNCWWGYGGVYVRDWRSLRFGESLESGFSHRRNVFALNLVCKVVLYMFFLYDFFNAKIFILFICDGSYATLVHIYYI